MGIEDRPEVTPSSGKRDQLAKLALFLVGAGLFANVVYVLAMKSLGYIYPYDSFLFDANDRWADFFKLAFAYPGEPLHRPVADWAIQPLVDFLEKAANAYRGTSINPDHLPPLPTLLAVIVRRAFVLFDPVLVFFACAAVALVFYAATLASFASRKEDRLRWIELGLISYPFWFMVDRGHFFSLICAITLMSAVRRMIVSRAMDWQTLLLLAVACNFRPNVVIVPAVLVLGGQAGRFGDLVRLAVFGAGVLLVSMLAAHALYPHYGPETWLAGLRDYNANYVATPMTLGFTTSVPSMLSLLFGASGAWSVLGLGLAAVLGVATLLAARRGLLTAGQIVFLALGLGVVAIPGFSDYHLIPFLLPIMLVAMQGTAMNRGDWIAVLASVVLLAPKNYIWVINELRQAWSYQVIVNPVVVLAAMTGVLALAFVASGKPAKVLPAS